jgi:diguanylate cyclase (GGDEF)-like protein
MNYQAIVLLNLFGIILLGFLAISRFMTRQRRRLGDKFFTALVLITMGASIVEIFSFWIDGKPGALCYWLNLFSNTLLYLSNLAGCFIWLLYVDLKLYRDRQRLKKMLPRYAIIPAICVLALIVNFFVPFLLYVDENNVYHRTSLCMVLYFFVLLTGLMSLLIYYAYRIRYGKKSFFPIWMFMAPVVGGCLAQGFVYGISTAWPATAIGICSIYMSLLNEKSFTDPLTSLFNRQYLEHTILVYGESKEFYGIMLDLNHFKEINDTFGHSMGDKALFRASRILHRAAGDKGAAFRFAGDEFVILVNSDKEEDVFAIEDQVSIMAKTFNEGTSEPYRLSFSMGHAKYVRGEAQDDFLRRMDLAMYEDKEKMHRLMDSEDGAEGALK